MKETRILVWDLPVRVFHWLLVATFAGAFLTAESERVRNLHVALGYTFAALLAFRLLWGLAGSRYARFSSFAFGPRAAARYLKSLLALRPDRHVGHNPAGAWMIFALIAAGLAVGATGYAAYVAGGHWIEELHEGAANAMLALVLVHVAGVVAGSFAHRENLIGAMVTGYKRGAPAEAIAGARGVVALVLVAAIVALWTALADVPATAGAAAATRIGGERPGHSHSHERGHDG